VEAILISVGIVPLLIRENKENVWGIIAHIYSPLSIFNSGFAIFD
jgi:hypothetical protein